MNPDRWNKGIVLQPTDRLFSRAIAPLIPRSVKPNHITVFRLFLTPIVVLLLMREWYAVGVPLFLFAALTDWFDGSLARVRRQVTAWGVIYDPVVDKLLIGSVLFLIVLEHINFTLGLALLGVEAFLVIVGWVRVTHGAIEPANKWGKIKMVAEVCGIMLLLLALWSGVDLLVDVSHGTLALALVFAIVSIFSRIR
jgi:CDP-diacylglycerol--glycerol-3-phosphate 3-phosphatidyltransferase